MRNIIRFDWAIKRLLRNKANFGILEGFLSELLGDDIKIESILESESNKESAANKSNRVDLLVQNSKEELIIVEVQSEYMRDYMLRMLFGTSKIIVDNIEEGMLYGRIKKVISVNIVFFDLGHGQDYIYHGGTSFVGINKHDVLSLSKQEDLVYHSDQIAEIFPEYYIIKVNQFDNVAKNTLDEWVNFLKNEVVNDNTKARGLKEAQEKLAVIKLSKEEKREYDWYIADWRDHESKLISYYEKGELNGITIGEQNKQKFAEEKVLEEKRTMVKNCLAEGMSIDLVSKITGLRVDEIKNLQ